MGFIAQSNNFKNSYDKHIYTVPNFFTPKYFPKPQQTAFVNPI